MEENNQEIKRCDFTGKICYTAEMATQKINSAKKHHCRRNRGCQSKKITPKRKYKCKYCGYFHLTHFKKDNWKKKNDFFL